MPECLVSIGSNLGDRDQALLSAQRAIERIDPNCSRLSSIHRTAPIGGPRGQGGYLNAVARFTTELSPRETLGRLQQAERGLSRTRGERWAPRTLDLDLLLYGDRVIDESGLRVPHPRMSYRPFVLAPATELAGSWVHPELGTTLDEILNVLKTGRDTVALLADRDDGAPLGWLHEIVPRVSIEPWSAGAPGSKLLIDARREPAGASFHGGPRLQLSDCPPEHWRDEVRAAVACVWPGESG